MVATTRPNRPERDRDDRPDSRTHAQVRPGTERHQRQRHEPTCDVVVPRRPEARLEEVVVDDAKGDE